MSSLEDVVRDSLEDHAREAPSGASLLEAVHRQAAQTRRRRTVLPYALGAAVVAASVAVVASSMTAPEQAAAPATQQPTESAQPTEPTEPTEPQPTELPWPRVDGVPEGLQAFSFHGLEVLVPAAWEHDDTSCGTPMADTIIVGSPPAAACAVDGPDDLTIVRIDAIGPDWQEFHLDAYHVSDATQPALLDGQPVLRGTVPPQPLASTDLEDSLAMGWTPREPFFTEVLVLPEQQVVISVESPDAEEALALIATTRIVPVDSHGCVDRYEPLEVSATHPEAAEILVPGTPTAATLCRYYDGGLARSADLSTGEMEELISVLNGLTPGVGRADPVEIAGGLECDYVAEGIIVQFQYPADEQLDVLVRVDSCDYLAASNGAREGIVTRQLFSRLGRVVGYSGGLPGLPCSPGTVYVQEQSCTG